MDVEILTYDADPNHGGFGGRVYALIRMFAEFAKVHVVLTDWFGGVRVPGVDYEELPLRDSALSRMLRLRTYYKTDFPVRKLAGRADLVIVESLDLWGLSEGRSGSPRILDEHNVYWELLDYDIENAPFFSTWLGRRKGVRGLLQPYLRRRAKAYEIGAIQRAEATFVTSDPDRARIVQASPGVAGRVHVLPNTVDINEFPDFSTRRTTDDVVFMGNYAYGPNRQAARFIADELAPAIGRARFLLVGASPPSLPHLPSNVLITGYVEDPKPILGKAAVCVAPLVQGSGTRLKILAYLAFGKAVVSTSKAAEGLEIQDGTHLLIRDDPASFRVAVQELLDDPEMRLKLGANGRRLVQEHYDWRTHVAWLRGLSRSLCGV